MTTILKMAKETKIEKVLRKLSDMNEFYKKIPKIKESGENHSSEKTNMNKKKE